MAEGNGVYVAGGIKGDPPGINPLAFNVIVTRPQYCQEHRSICTKMGLHFAFLPPTSFQLRAGGDVLKEYLFNQRAIKHQLCGDCGVDVFARGKRPDGTDVVALNVSCIDGIELSKLAMTAVDGKNR